MIAEDYRGTRAGCDSLTVQSAASPNPHPRVTLPTRWSALLPAVLAAILVAAPLIGLAITGLAGLRVETWQGLIEGGLSGFAGTSAALLVLVAVGVALTGGVTGWLTAAYVFPGSRYFAWLLVLPLAMPGYVVAYAYADLLQFSGPVQTWLRETSGWGPREYWFPEVRSLPGAAVLFVCVLFPYVYLPVRAAVQAVPASLIEAARLSGLPARAVVLRVVLPLAWPAVAGGVILCSMEVLADYGAVSYLAVDTLSVGIYKAWLGYGDRVSAVQLALVLLVVVGALMIVESRLRGRRRFAARGGPVRGSAPVVLRGAKAWSATIVCVMPVIAGFVLPLATLLRVAVKDAESHQWDRYARAAWASFTTAGVAAIVVVLVALLLAYGARMSRSRAVGLLNRVASLGYGVPGAVLAIAILIPLARLDNMLDAWVESLFGQNLGLLLTGSVTALVYAYVVRFLAVGLSNLETGFGRVTPSMDDAARSLGVTGLALVARVHLPLLWRVLLVAGLLVFVDALKELPATLALRPFDFDTLATQSYQYAKDERLGEAAVPSLVIVLVAMLPALLVTRVLARD